MLKALKRIIAWTVTVPAQPVPGLRVLVLHDVGHGGPRDAGRVDARAGGGRRARRLDARPVGGVAVAGGHRRVHRRPVRVLVRQEPSAGEHRLRGGARGAHPHRHHPQARAAGLLLPHEDGRHPRDHHHRAGHARAERHEDDRRRGERLRVGGGRHRVSGRDGLALRAGGAGGRGAVGARAGGHQPTQPEAHAGHARGFRAPVRRHRGVRARAGHGEVVRPRQLRAAADVRGVRPGEEGPRRRGVRLHAVQRGAPRGAQAGQRGPRGLRGLGVPRRDAAAVDVLGHRPALVHHLRRRGGRGRLGAHAGRPERRAGPPRQDRAGALHRRGRARARPRPLRHRVRGRGVLLRRRCPRRARCCTT